MWHFTVSAAAPYLTISAFLRQQHFSQTLRRRIQRNGKMTKNGQPASLGDFLTNKDEIIISLPGSALHSVVGVLDIVFEDDFFLAVNKPAGLLTHPLSSGVEASLVNIALHHCRKSNPNSSLHPITRLDRNTSGLLLLAKNPYDHHFVQQHSMQKTYLALLESTPPTPAGDIFLPIARKPGSIIERQISFSGQFAHSSYQIIQKYQCHTLVQFTLHTGRTHQIRVHAAACGFPLVGDDLYGKAKAPPLPGQALHAWRLSFYHPHTDKEINLLAPVPASWHTLFK